MYWLTGRTKTKLLCCCHFYFVLYYVRVDFVDFTRQGVDIIMFRNVYFAYDMTSVWLS